MGHKFSVTNNVVNLSGLFTKQILNGPTHAADSITGLSMTLGSAIVTRAAGSFIDDRVKPWSTLTGALAAKFPGGTLIQSVDSHTQITMTNNATGTTATVAGGFTPNLGIDEDANFTMDNLILGGRYVPWVSLTTGPTQITCKVDLGSAATTAIIGCLANDGDGGLADIFSGTAYNTTTTSRGTIALGSNARDGWNILSPTTTHRFWQFDFKFKSGSTRTQSTGLLWFGNLTLDLGQKDSIGSIYEESWIRRRVETLAEHPIEKRMQSGNVSASQQLPRRRFELQFRNVGASVSSILQNNVYRGTKDPFVFVDGGVSPYHVQVVDPFRDLRGFEGVHTIPLVLEEMP